MTAALKIAGFEASDVLRGKWAILYGVAFFLLTDGLFRFSADSSKVTLSLINVVLFLTPLVSVVFGAIHSYNSREFIELTLAQPIRRRTVFGGMYIGLSGSLIIVFLLGVVAPYIIHASSSESFLPLLMTLVMSGVALTLVFVALAFLVSFLTDDKGKGLGSTMLMWVWFAIIFDGLILLTTFVFEKYPLEGPIIAMTMFNPIDLARILLLLQVDVSALMGYTGAVFERFFGETRGSVITWASIIVWIVVPVYLGMRRFEKKDF